MNSPVARRGNTFSAQPSRHGSTPIGAIAILATAVALAGWGSVRAADQAPAAKPTQGAATKKAAAPAAAGATDAAKAPANPKSAASYSIGLSMGEQLHRFGLGSDAVSVDRIMAGIRDGMTGKAKMTDADQQNIAALIKTARSGQVDANHAIADKFLAENGKKPDIKTTASGLQYKVLSAGSGTSPTPTDEVTVDYAGRLLDGTEFDSSYKRGQPATFPVNGVIPGWTEALQLMKPGAKFQLFIPPKLAYDANVPPGAEIPPGSLLVFDVELKSVKPHTAAPPPHPAIAPPAPK